jgi:hypothetical protein
MQDIVDILEAKLVSVQSFTDIWSSVERNEYEDAMYNQFFYLFYTDEFESRMNKLSESDKQFMDYLIDLATKGK